MEDYRNIAQNDTEGYLQKNVIMLLYEKLGFKRLILASKSPRRRQLLEGCGLDFVPGEDYSVVERYPESMSPESVPLFLAELKSEAYPCVLAEDDILVTADTVVILENKILGKPRDRAEAISMIKELSARKHSVVTGVVIRNHDRKKGFSVKSNVWMRSIRQEEIEYYVDKYKPYDKAGAYGIQEWIGYTAVQRIEGSFYNVMGLPVQALYVELEKFLDGE